MMFELDNLQKRFSKSFVHITRPDCNSLVSPRWPVTSLVAESGSMSLRGVLVALFTVVCLVASCHPGPRDLRTPSQNKRAATSTLRPSLSVVRRRSNGATFNVQRHRRRRHRHHAALVSRNITCHAGRFTRSTIDADRQRLQEVANQAGVTRAPWLRLSSSTRHQANKKKLIEEDSGPLGVLIFTLRNAKNLKAADSNGKSDPFVVVRLPGMPTLQPFKSKTKRRTLNPEWNQQHEFPGYLADIVRKPLELRVYDWDALSFNDPLGSLSVPLWDLFRQRLANSKLTTGEEGTRQVAQLHFTDVPLQGVDTGTISFSVTFELKFVLGMLPGTPVHASAAQALRRPPPSDATCLERAATSYCSSSATASSSALRSYGPSRYVALARSPL